MTGRTLSLYALAAAAAVSLGAASSQSAVQQRLAEIKQSIVRNKAQLRQYAWTETTEISLKGEVKKREQNDCMYGPDGNVQKTLIGAPPAPANKPGIRGKIVANKIADLKDYMDRVGSLLRRYIPPDPQAMQAAFAAGKVTLIPVSGQLVFNDYAKPGDKVTVTFDQATKRLLSFAVATYLDAPKDTVTVNARFSSLPDGTNFLQESVLIASAKEIQITKTNFGYRRLGA